MEDRVAVLEQEVVAIKSGLAVLRHDFGNTADLNPRGTRIDLKLVSIRRDISQLQKDVSLLQKEVAKLKEDVDGIRIELAKLAPAQSPYRPRPTSQHLDEG